jgi:hypothetical protein
MAGRLRLKKGARVQIHPSARFLQERAVPSEPVGPVKPVDRVVPVAIRGQKDNGNSANPDFIAERRQQHAADPLPSFTAGHADAAEQRGMGHIDRSFAPIAKHVKKFTAHAKGTEKQRNQAGK